MTIFLLDSSAVLRLLDAEPGADRVEEILDAHSARSAEAIMSAVQWGEVAGLVRRRRGQAAQQQALNDLGFFQMRIEPATAARAVRAAEIKEDRKVPYADAFVIELALDSPNSIVLTADYDFKKVIDLVNVEFLPLK